jgi:outer membrane protein OmpA-like peptidoglycan-associated protein
MNIQIKENDMKRNVILKALTSMALAVSLSANASVQSIDMSPLSSKVSVSSKSVSNDKQLPQILWGADMTVLFANGLKPKTQKGSVYNKAGLDFELSVKNSVIEQAEDYISGKTPYFRGTLDQVAMLNDLVYAEPDLRPVVLHQLSWSKGGDNLVVKSGIKSVQDLRGKTIAIMAYGPHVYFMHRVLQSAGLKISDVNIVWTENLDGDKSPFSAFYDNSVDAAFMITPDALAVVEGDNALSGSNILFSTRQADKFVADVNTVRADYYAANKDKLQSFVHSYFLAHEAVGELVKNKNTRKAEYNKWLQESSQQFMGTPDLIEDMEGLFLDANHTGFAENVSFFTNDRDARNFDRLSIEINDALMEMKLVKAKNPIQKADWNWDNFRSGLKNADQVVVPKFNRQAVSKVVAEMQARGTLEDGQFLREQVYFDVGSSNFVFNKILHGKIFDKVIDDANSYSGALIIVEGHSDPAHYLISKFKNKVPLKTLKRIRQSARDLSRQRAEEVRSAVIEYARDIRGVNINATQFEVVGYGIDNPETGVCNGEPCKIDLKGQAAKEAYGKNRRANISFTTIQAEVEVSADDFDF